MRRSDAESTLDFEEVLLLTAQAPLEDAAGQDVNRRGAERSILRVALEQVFA